MEKYQNLSLPTMHEIQSTSRSMDSKAVTFTQGGKLLQELNTVQTHFSQVFPKAGTASVFLILQYPITEQDCNVLSVN